MKKPIIDVIIPVCHPDEKYARLLKMLEKQSVHVNHVYVINTGKEYYNEKQFEYSGEISVRHIKEDEFDHGRTRHEDRKSVV